MKNVTYARRRKKPFAYNNAGWIYPAERAAVTVTTCERAAVTVTFYFML